MRDLMRRAMASRWFDPALASLVTVSLLAEAFGRPDGVSSPLAPVAAVLLGVPVALRRTHPVAAGLAEAALLAATTKLISEDLEFGPGLGVVILAYSAGAYASWRHGIAIAVALIAGAQVHMGFSDFPNFELAFVVLGPWWIGSQIARRRTLIAELQARTAELAAEQDAFARLSVRHERARIAHELHDIVAHHLAVIVVQAGAGRMAPAGASDKAAEHLGAIRQAGDQALAEVARLVDILHVDQQDGAGGLSKLRVLVDEANATGAHVRLQPLPPAAEVPRDVEDEAYRVVREGLTNAAKHAPGAPVRVRLRADDSELEVDVRNEPSAEPSSLARTGSALGLAGMRERVEALGGTLSYGPADDGGWELRACLPVAVPAKH